MIYLLWHPAWWLAYWQKEGERWISQIERTRKSTR